MDKFLTWTQNAEKSEPVEIKTKAEIDTLMGKTTELPWNKYLKINDDGYIPLADTSQSDSYFSIDNNLQVNSSYQIADWWVPVDYHFNINYIDIPPKRAKKYYWGTTHNGEYANSIKLLFENAPNNRHLELIASDNGSTYWANNDRTNVPLEAGENIITFETIKLGVREDELGFIMKQIDGDDNYLGISSKTWYLLGAQQSLDGDIAYQVNFAGKTYAITQYNVHFGFSAEA